MRRRGAQAARVPSGTGHAGRRGRKTGRPSVARKASNPTSIYGMQSLHAATPATGAQGKRCATSRIGGRTSPFRLGNCGFWAHSQNGTRVPDWDGHRRFSAGPCGDFPLDSDIDSREALAAAVVKQNHKTRKAATPPRQEGGGRATSAVRTEQAPTDLHMSIRSSLSDLAPGEIVFLDDFAHLREAFAPIFVAVLACPSCGSPGLITSGQYFGGTPIVCTSKTCSGLYRIVGEAQIISLPPS